MGYAAILSEASVTLRILRLCNSSSMILPIKSSSSPTVIPNGFLPTGSVMFTTPPGKIEFRRPPSYIIQDREGRVFAEGCRYLRARYKSVRFFPFRRFDRVSLFQENLPLNISDRKEGLTRFLTEREGGISNPLFVKVNLQHETLPPKQSPGQQLPGNKHEV